MKKLYLVGVLFVLALATSALCAQVPAIRLIPFISSGLSSPVFMTSARDGTNRLFIVQQGGIIRVLQPGSTTPTDFLNITSRVLSGGERGLLGLAFHPQYSTNRRFFVYYTRQTDGAIQIAEYQASAANPDVANTTEKIIITIPHPSFSNHNGGTVAFGPDGYLYAGPGDGGSGNDPPNNAQNVNQLLGKIIRLDIDNVPQNQVPQYNIPPTNPFGGETAGADEIYATGMRNPYRFSFDRGGTGQLWAADVGQGSWEEVDIITNGGNFGWRLYEGNACTNIAGAGCAFPPNYVGPLFEYSSAGAGNPRCSITGGFVYRGSQGNLPAGGYVYGDYCSGEILVWANNQQNLLLDTTRSIVAFAEDEAGEIYVIGQSGTIERIVRAEVSISGRVSTPSGQGLRNATVNLTDALGVRRTATTSSFGIYQFDNVATGQTYTMSVSSKRFRFAPRIENISNQVSNLDFVGLE
jgi:glucose/arabinose dehydrogenase